MMTTAGRYLGAWTGPMAAALLALAAAAGAEAPPAIALSESDRADLARVEDYLTRIDTVSSRFLQVASNGSYSEGTFHLRRPGRMRIEYDPPVPILIVADGRHLIYHDRKLEQVSYLGIESSPAAVLLSEKVAFSGALAVVGFERGPGVLQVTVVRTADPLEGAITLVFSDQPLALRKWVVTDAQGTTTTVSLLGTRFGVPLDPELFHFVDPSLFKPRD